MKKFFSAKLLASYVLSLMSYITANAQAGEWTWMKGSNGAGAAGNFGSLGVADPANTPPALYGAGPFTDKQGNFWLFAGDNGASYAALWKYEPVTNEWTWMKGPSTTSQYGVYGTMGVGNINNHPGSRAYGFLTWTDTTGNFWIYGGTGNSSNTTGYLSDLWKYEVATNTWTWMKGSSTLVGLLPVYGTLGQSDPANSPGSRFEVTCGWTDNQNRLWFFGGYDGGIGVRDDVWMYDISINEWTWMAGSNVAGALPSYGTQGVFSATNTPGSRLAYSHWKDADGNLWTFGGGYPDEYADMWEFDVTLSQWAWISGVNSVNYWGTLGPKCTATTNTPGSRSENRGSITDCCGNFWLFGGGDANGNPCYNDLWVYDPVVNEWSWVSGDSTMNPQGTYGTLGVSSPTNVPPGKTGVTSWVDDQQNLWFFGGANSIWTNDYNDVWRYVPDPLCHACNIVCNVTSQASFVANDTDICEKFCINFFDSSQGNPTSWLWLFPGGNPSSSTDQNPANVCYNTPGIYDVTLITTNAGGNDTLTLSNYITVYTNPFAPVISQVGNTLTSTPATSYQWQLNSVDIPGATNQSYTISQSGLYTVIIGDGNGCTAQASVDATYVGIDEVEGNSFVNVFPNPSSGEFTIELTNGLIAGNVSFDMVNTLGQKIFSSEEKITTANFKTEIYLGDLVCGVYFIEIKSQNIFLKKKIIISK